MSSPYASRYGTLIDAARNQPRAPVDSESDRRKEAFVRFLASVAPVAGSAIGGGIGAAVGGPVGAGIGMGIGGGVGQVAGAGLGYGADEMSRAKDEQEIRREARRQALLSTLGSLR